ncbi:MAG: TldD/PmbA family protein [Candidatus Hodarchaeales archaeon]
MKELVSYINGECIKKGASFSEVRIVQYDKLEFVFNDGRKNWSSLNKILEINLKIWKEDTISSGYTTASDKHSLDELIDSTMDESHIIKDFNANIKTFEPVLHNKDNSTLVEEAETEVSTKDKLKFIKTLQAAIKEKSEDIKTYLTYSDKSGYFYFGNSEGYFITDRISEFILETSMELVYALKRMNRTFTHAGRLSAASFDLKLASSLGRTHASRFLNSVLVPLPPKKKMNIIMDGELSGRIIHELVHGIEGDILVSARSPWKKKKGKEIFSDKLTIIDDPQYGLSQRTLKVNYDADGFQRKTTTIVEKGVLKNFITDVRSSSNLKVENTCSARNTADNTYTFPVSTNLVVKEGDKSLKDLVKEAEEGVLCQGALQVDIDWKNQIIKIIPEQAVFIANGILKEDVYVSVEIDYPVDDLMKRLVSLGDKPRVSFTHCTKGGGIICSQISPAMLFERLTVKM